MKKLLLLAAGLWIAAVIWKLNEAIKRDVESAIVTVTPEEMDQILSTLGLTDDVAFVGQSPDSLDDEELTEFERLMQALFPPEDEAR